MHIRSAEVADEEALAHIRRSAIMELAAPVISMEQASAWAMHAAPDRVTRAIRDHIVRVVVEEIPIGWVEVERDHIAALYVLPCRSGRGIGSALLTEAEIYIQRSGYRTACLEASRNALEFYLRRGYLRCGKPDSDGAWPLRKDLTISLGRTGG